MRSKIKAYASTAELREPQKGVKMSESLPNLGIDLNEQILKNMVRKYMKEVKDGGGEEVEIPQ